MNYFQVFCQHCFADKGPSSQSYGFSSSHVWMWELDCEEGWAPKNWCFWTVVLTKTFESPLDCVEIQPVHPKGDQSWVFIGNTDVESETQILWPPDTKRWLIRKAPGAGKDWGQEEKGTTEDEMVGWHHQLDGHGFECIPGVGDRQGGLACCGSWGRKESDTTEWLNWTELKEVQTELSEYGRKVEETKDRLRLLRESKAICQSNLMTHRENLSCTSKVVWQSTRVVVWEIPLKN